LNFTTSGIENNPNYEDTVRNIIHSVLDPGDLDILQTERMVKIFLMDQMLVEYLLNIQEKLFKKNQKIVDFHENMKSTTSENLEELEKNRMKIDRLRSKRNILKKKNQDYRILRKKIYAFQCPYCEKAFSSLDYLEKHLVKRHIYEVRQAKEHDLRLQIEKDKKEEEKKLKARLEREKMEAEMNKGKELEMKRLAAENEQRMKRLEKLLKEKEKLIESSVNQNNALLEENKRLSKKNKLKENQMSKLQREKERLKKEKEEIEKLKEQAQKEKANGSKEEKAKPEKKMVTVAVILNDNERSKQDQSCSQNRK
jgi:uncharacterized C2H2 Zn-finger protein